PPVSSQTTSGRVTVQLVPTGATMSPTVVLAPAGRRSLRRRAVPGGMATPVLRTVCSTLTVVPGAKGPKLPPRTAAFRIIRSGFGPLGVEVAGAHPDQKSLRTRRQLPTEPEQQLG